MKCLPLRKEISYIECIDEMTCDTFNLADLAFAFATFELSVVNG